MTYRGKWHGKKYYFGLHYDLHARKDDKDLGTRCGKKDLVPMLKRMGPDFVQTDCKGHPGYTSWFSKSRHASVPPGLKKDALRQWREATRALGLPLHCHYSGIYDTAAGKKHRDWCAVDADGKVNTNYMCPLSPYVDKLMIPQMLELVDRYDVDGFWVDGELWAVQPCYCRRCRNAFEKESGISDPPVSVDDPAWPAWWNFIRVNFERYVNRYCDAVHRHKPGTLLCSNWLQTFNHPGAPDVATDWISGDNVWVFGLDQSRCEARFLSTRGKPWDIMLWNFYCSHGMSKPESPWTVKPPEMLMQEAAVLLSLGGNVQIYDTPHGVRDGRLAQWSQARFGDVGRFVKRRRALCQDSESIPQIAVLHSETHARSCARSRNLREIDVAPVQGAVYALLEKHYGVDVLDEWALLPRLAEFPAVVVPERHAISGAMVSALKTYVRNGGRLIVSGSESFDRFGPAFIGAGGGRTLNNKVFHVPAADGAVPLFSATWRLLKPQRAIAAGALRSSSFMEDRALPYPAAVINRMGKGRVAYIPSNVFRDFEHNRYILTREFIAEIVGKTVGKLPIRISAPACVDVALRRKRGRIVIHLVNRLSGIPNQPNNGAVDEIPPAGPVTAIIRRAERPPRVSAPLEKGGLKWKHSKGVLTVQLPRVRIHEAIVI